MYVTEDSSQESAISSFIILLSNLDSVSSKTYKYLILEKSNHFLISICHIGSCHFEFLYFIIKFEFRNIENLYVYIFIKIQPFSIFDPPYWIPQFWIMNRSYQICTEWLRKPIYMDFCKFPTIFKFRSAILDPAILNYGLLISNLYWVTSKTHIYAFL